LIDICGVNVRLKGFHRVIDPIEVISICRVIDTAETISTGYLTQGEFQTMSLKEYTAINILKVIKHLISLL
jgi:hypothetical protein